MQFRNLICPESGFVPLFPVTYWNFGIGVLLHIYLYFSVGCCFCQMDWFLEKGYNWLVILKDFCTLLFPWNKAFLDGGGV